MAGLPAIPASPLQCTRPTRSHEQHSSLAEVWPHGSRGRWAQAWTWSWGHAMDGQTDGSSSLQNPIESAPCVGIGRPPRALSQ